jgi:hypothetical protein
MLVLMDLPPRDDGERAMATPGGRIDIPFDVDLGELINGHHIVARGIERGALARRRWLERDSAGELKKMNAPVIETEAALHFDVFPGLEEDEELSKGFQYDLWELGAEDNVGTRYRSGNGCCENRGPAVSQGYLFLGAQIPESATLLTLRFQPAEGWEPPEPWLRRVLVDLRTGRVET